MNVGVLEVDVARLGGRQRTMLAFARYLKTAGHSVRFYSAPPGPGSNASVNGVIQAAESLTAPDFVWQRLETLRPEQVVDRDVLLASLPYFGQLQFRLHKPVVCWAIHPDQHPTADVVHWTNSRTTLGRLQARDYWQGRLIDIVIPPHDYSRFRAAGKPWCERQYDVVTVGGLLRAKGLIEVDRLCARLGVRSLILGAKRQAFSQEGAKVLTALTHSKVILDAPRQVVADLMGDSRVYLCLSYEESCPLVIYEALNAGCNVVSRDVGAIAEQLGGYGRVFQDVAHAPLQVERSLLAPDEGVARGLMFDSAHVGTWVELALRRAIAKDVSVPAKAVTVRRYPSAAFIGQQREVESKVSVVVKTFDRPQCLARLLQSIRACYPRLQVHIVDDGTTPAEEICARDPYVTYTYLDVDVGVGASRNYALEQVKTPFVLKVDDDFVFGRHTDLGGALERLVWHRFDTLSGATLWEKAGHDRTLVKQERLLLRRYYGLMQLEGTKAVLRAGHHCIRGDCLQVDIAPDFFLARTNVLARHRWDPEIKICGAHMDFFWRAKQAELCVGYWEGLQVLHVPYRTRAYNKFRVRMDFLELAANKNGLSAFVDPTGFGGWIQTRLRLQDEAPWLVQGGYCG